MKTMYAFKNVVSLLIIIPTIMLSGCAGDLAFIKPTDKQIVANSLPQGATTVDIPIEIDFTGNTRARNIVLDSSLNITTAPAAGFNTTTGGGQQGWDRMSGKYPMTPGNHTLTASAEYLDYTRATQTISKTVQFTVAPPDLWPVVEASPTTANVAQHVTFTITVHNLGQSDAQNVSILFHTALPAYFISVQPNAGFQCYIPNGYYPRFGMQCDGGTVARQDTVTISVVLSFPSTGSKVLSVFVDPNNTIIEGFENNNLANTTVIVN